MIKMLFRPAMVIMNRLSYPLKFAIVSALFAVPLTITSVQTILDRQYEISSVEYTHQGMLKIKAFHPIITELERLRDLSLTQRILDNSKLTELFDASRKKATLALNNYIQDKRFEHNQLLSLTARNLQISLKKLQTSTGSEGDTVYNIFDNVNFLIDDAYTLQSKTANEHGLLSDRNILATQMTTLLIKDFQAPMEAMGRARAYGIYFINAAVIGSQGITLLEETFQKLSRLEERLRQRFTLLFSSHSELLNNKIINPDILVNMNEVSYLIEESLLLDPDLTMTWEDYYQKTSQAIEQMNILQFEVVSFLLSHYQQRALELKHEREMYALSIGALIGLFLYLFVGFYLTVRNSIEGLSQAARHVAEGALDEEFVIESYDEMGKLAKVFDTMRGQLKERHQQLIEQAITDGLTGIHNRKYFNDRLIEQVALCRRIKKPMTLLLLDIDHFKKLNDTYGHQAGDYCLQEVAKHLKKCLGRQSDAVSRYGGEEFTVLLPATDLPGGEKVAEQLCDEIRKLSLEYNSQELSVTISIGIACTAHINGFNEDNLVSLADSALYQAKESGRDRSVSAHEAS